MLENYKKEQPIAFKIFNNALKSQKFSHAYLIESNGYEKTFDLVLLFAKMILNLEKNNSDLLELKVINKDGNNIKKEQIDELQDIFNKKAILGNKKVYIINELEKMKETTANSLLKFIEEPEEGIIALLITNNIYQILPTIISRCQVISLINSKKENQGTTKERIGNYLFNSKEKSEEFILDENSDSIINKVIEFAKFYENNRINTIIHLKKLWHDFFTERKDVIQAFEILLLMYKDALNLKLGKDMQFFIDYKEDVALIENKNTIDYLVNKINVIRDLKDKIKYNINLGLLMDKLVIELERCM